ALPGPRARRPVRGAPLGARRRDRAPRPHHTPGPAGTRPLGAPMSGTIGETFVAALAAKDTLGLRKVLDPALDFRALTPGKFWESSSADEVIDEILLGPWFEPTDTITA